MLLAGAAGCALLSGLSARADDAVGDTSGKDEIIVQSTMLRSQQKSLEIERQADNIKDVTLEDEMRRLPDANIAEALQRIPGISMESDSGSGRFVNIRGFDADLNGSYFDGVHLTANNQNASPMGGGRAVAFDVFPAGLIGGLEVVKTLTPSMDAEGIGGQVNMLGHTMPIGGAPFFEADIAGGVETLRDNPVYQGSVTAGTSFGLDGHTGAATPFRIVVTLAYREDQRGIDDVEESYPSGGSLVPLSTLEERWYQYHRITQGGTFELDYDPSTRFGLYAKGMSSGYWESADKHELLYNGLDGSNTNGTLTSLGNGNYVATNAGATQRFIDTAEQITSSVLSGGGHYDFDRARIDFRGGYAYGSDTFTHSYTIDFATQTPFTAQYQDADPSHRTLSILTPGISAADPAQYALDRIRNQPSHAFDEEYSTGVDLTIDTGFLSPEDQAKIGGSVRLRDRGFDQTNYSGSPAGTVPLSPYVNTAPVSYYNSWYDIGPNINHSAVLATTPLQGTYNIGSFARGTENVYAGYVEYHAHLDRLDIVGGVRVENTDGQEKAYLNNPDGSYSLNTTSQNYTDVFPSIQAKYQLDPALQLRASYSTGIARPGFNQISASTQVDYSNLTYTSGNPNLKPQKANDFDLGADYDLPGGGNAGVGLFYKDFSNYIVADTYFGTYQGQAGYLFTSYHNIASSRADGIEFKFSKPLTFLPQPFDGLGVDGNYTFVDSSAQLRPGEKDVRLPQTSPENYNLGLYYDKGPIYLRAAASYVSANLWGIGGDRTTDIFSQGRFRLDLGASYQLTDNLQVYFDAKNLTNTKLQFTQGSSPSNPIQREFYDSDYLGGVRLKF